MAPRKRRGSNGTPSRRPGRKQTTSEPQDPYQSLVAEYIATEEPSGYTVSHETERSSKRRRVGTLATDDESVVSATSDTGSRANPTSLQVAYEDFGDEDSEEDSDVEFEDVDFAVISGQSANRKPAEDLNLVLGADEKSSNGPSSRRRVLLATDRKLRLSIHKMHTLALISHVRLRSFWCNDAETQKSLKSNISLAVRKMLNDDPDQSQWQRTRSLKMGLEKAAELFRDNFNINTRGISRCYWSESASQAEKNAIPEDIDLPITKEDFRDLATARSGSRDLGAQMFCASLRSLGLDAILKPVTPSKPAPTVIPFHDTRTGMNGERSTEKAQGVHGNVVSQGVRRFGHAPASGHASTRTTIAAVPGTPKKKRLRESPFPVYWVEVFNEADQKWIPVDPFVTKLVDKPSKYEPPANDSENSMSYVIAVDEDGFLRDVTRRYVHAYNAKTRRLRVEATRDGSKWWQRVLRVYRDPLPQDRNQVEDGELNSKEAREPMPRNIIEFKNHPYYALERHLRQNEVLHPKRQVGTVSAGANKQMEPIYRRNDVHLVRSADAWFRVGRQVKLGEEPLKYLEPKKNQGRNQKVEDNDDIADDMGLVQIGTPLYAAYQTQQYIPPPIFNGIVPKNVYGNIDVYTPSMVPAGGVWINHPFAGGAAKLLLVDWADAVTGFEFRGRTGKAVMKGIVVAGEYHEAIVETIRGLQYAFQEEETSKRTAQVLFVWKRFLLALRIRERIKSYYVEGEELEARLQSERDEEPSGSEYEDNNEADGGGFLPGEHQDQSDTDVSMPDLPDFVPAEAEPMSKALEDSMAPILSTWGKPLPLLEPVPTALEPLQDQQPFPVQDYGGGFFVVDENETATAGGGFMVEDDESLAGGFFPEGDVALPLQKPAVDAANAGTEQITKADGEKPSSLARESQQPESTDQDDDDGQKSSQNHSSSQTEVKPEDSEPQLSREDSRISESAGSLISHDPEDDDAEPEWI